MHLLIAIAALAALATAQLPKNVSGGPLQPDQACYDVRHYTLRLDVVPETKSISGSLVMRATALGKGPRLALDLDPAFEVAAVELNGARVEFVHANGRITFAPPTWPETGKDFEVTVRYGGAPHVAVNPPWNGGFTWAQTKAGKPWIATSCQGEGGDLWWPCKDHPSDKPDGVDLFITVPEGLTVASNGTMQGEPRIEGGRATFHWREAQPISNYCVALNIAPYVLLKDTFECVDGTRMPIEFFVLPESAEKARRCMPQFLDHLRVFEHLLGPYPFRSEKYGIAETPFLGMEHQTIIAYGNGFRDEQYDWLHNHELAHEWWGNLVTCRDWKDMWIHEGFGTYMQPLYKEIRFGRQAYQREMVRQRTIDRAAIAPREVKTSQQIYFGPGGSNDIYNKGSWVLHTLRYELGDEKFFTLLRRFCYPTPALEKATDGSQCRLVDTDDFVAMCSEVAGEDMAWFFEVYVRQPHLPTLSASLDDGLLKIRWTTPGDLPFHLDVPVILGGKEVRVPMTGGHGELRVGDREYRVDPDRRVLAKRGEGLK